MPDHNFRNRFLANFFSEAFDYCTNFRRVATFPGATPTFPADCQIGDVGHHGYGGDPSRFDGRITEKYNEYLWAG